MVANKLEWRSLESDEKMAKRQLHRLIFCEHSHVYTLGKSGSIDHLLIDQRDRDRELIEFYKINRGGDITYHGPGQITGYPIFDLDEYFTDVHKYVRCLEECIIKTLEDYDIEGIRIPKHTGVWLAPNSDQEHYRKICAIGVHLSRWVTMHGFAFNINTDLKYFEYIIPCGIDEPDKTVTSLAQELGGKVNMGEVKSKLKRNFAEIFNFDFSIDE